MTLGESVFLGLFILPFVAIGLAMLLAFLCCCFGENLVIIDGHSGATAIALGHFRWSRRFDASRVSSIVEGVSNPWRHEEGESPVIEIHADRKVRLGFLLTKDRRVWLIAALRCLLLHTGTPARIPAATPGG